MSTEKYAQYISRQQRQLSVSGTNTPVGTLDEALGSMANIKAASKKGYEDSRRGQPPLSDKQKKIASQAGDPEKIDAEDFAKLRAMKKEEAEIEEAKARTSDRYLGSVERDDPDYEKKVGELKGKATGGARVRGRLGKDNPNRALYGKGGPLKSMTAQDIKPEHAKRVDVYSKKSMKKEEVEELDELSKDTLKSYVDKAKLDRTDKGVHLKRLNRDIEAGEQLKQTYGKKYDNPEFDAKRQKERDDTIKAGKQRSKYIKIAQKKLTKEEASYISEEESVYLEEMVGKGKLKPILDYHKNNMDHHEKMLDHHSMMADKSEAVGDSEGWDYHIGKAMGHDMDREHHEARYNHALGLAAKAKAHKEIKDAEAKIRAARQAKKEY